jgi:glycosyltransferase involved in cell wall biosynthesis
MKNLINDGEIETGDCCSLVFVTYEYPYGLSETFIESEIEFLSQHFSNIAIIPSRAFFSKKWLAKQQSTSKRQLPMNCEVVLPTRDSVGTVFLAVNALIRLLGHIHLSIPQGSKISRVINEIFREASKAAIFYARLATVFEDDRKFGMVYSYWKSPAVTALCLFNSDVNRRFSLVTRCHRGDLYYDLPELPSRPYDKMVSKNADYIVSISDQGSQHLIEHGFVKDRIKVHRLGVYVPENTSKPSEDGIWRIVSCSNIIQVKRVPLIAAALTKLGHPFIWTHFGDGIERNLVEQIVQKFPDHGSAILPGRLTNKQLLDFYQANPVDLFINVSTSEGVPVSIMEALGAGIPCLATDVGGTSEVVDASVGRLLPVEVDAQEIASAITDELSESSEWLSKRKYARRRSELMCDANNNYTDFAKFLRTVCGVKKIELP